MNKTLGFGFLHKHSMGLPFLGLRSSGPQKGFGHYLGASIRLAKVFVMPTITLTRTSWHRSPFRVLG